MARDAIWEWGACRLPGAPCGAGLNAGSGSHEYLTGLALIDMKMLNARHVQNRLAAVLREVEGGEVIEVHRRGRPVARIVPVSTKAPSTDWSEVARRLAEINPSPVKGTTAAQIILDDRSER